MLKLISIPNIQFYECKNLCHFYHLDILVLKKCYGIKRMWLIVKNFQFYVYCQVLVSWGPWAAASSFSGRASQFSNKCPLDWNRVETYAEEPHDTCQISLMSSAHMRIYSCWKLFSILYCFVKWTFGCLNLFSQNKQEK